MLDNIENPEAAGIYVLRRRYNSFDQSANDLADYLFRLCQLDRKSRIALRNRIDQESDRFDWHNLAKHYDEAYSLALSRIGAAL